VIQGPLFGRVPGLLSKVTPEHPVSEEVWWAESVRIDFDDIDGRSWIALKPDVWIWPKHARAEAVDFVSGRTSRRFNSQTDALLSAWIALLFPGVERAKDSSLSPFGGVESDENPQFVVNVRTAFSRRARA
jgi:hypothetical protein